MPESIEEKKKMALRLFEQGDYSGSYSLCRDLIPGSPDPALSILCATNLFHMGRLEEAEAYFRDLIHSLPGSSHVHSYLGRILEQKGDEGALLEFARAISLDPGNLEALRSYGSYALAAGDPAKAVRVARYLVAKSGRADDTRFLIRALRLAGMPEDALAEWIRATSYGLSVDEEYIEVLYACGKYAEMAVAARELWERTSDPAVARRYLAALAHSDPGTAAGEYERILAATGDPGIRLDYVRLYRDHGEYSRALGELGLILASPEVEPVHLLEECELLAGTGRKEEAESHYRRLIEKELDTLGDLEFLRVLLNSYRGFLRTHYPVKEAGDLLVSRLGSHAEVTCLLAMASFYEDIGDHAEARSWYYRAYRSDFLAGGPEYARFCEHHGDVRECEKVMLYILNSIRKNSDLIRVAGMVMEDTRALYRMPRLMERLKERLLERSGSLSSRGLEYLSLALLVSASNSLDAGDHPACKRSCLEGLDYIPPGASSIHPEDFLAILKECKARSLCDLPALLPSSAHEEPAGEPGEATLRALDLDDQERKLLDFLKTHHQASEMDLRLLLGTRRVVGIVNRIIQKASQQGLVVIEKRGVGKDGEIYAYRRT